MSLPTQHLSFLTSRKAQQAAGLLARQERIPVWALPRLFIGIIGLGFFFTFFDIGDINVSFIQTCTQIVAGCLPQTASHYLGLPVMINLVGYMVGALIFSLFADRFGRRDLLVFTMMIAGLGSLYTAFVSDYTNFVIARAITGIGVGADLALVNTYLNEFAPLHGRVKYTALVYILATCGITLSVWLGLYLTTPATPFPEGLPFALASSQFALGWRVLYGLGTLLTLVGLFLRIDLPESPRWLITRGRLAEAENVVVRMERQALKRVRALPPVGLERRVAARKQGISYGEIFRDVLYVKRTILLLVIWLAGYVTVYSLVAGLTVLLTALGYAAPEAGMISAMGICGSVICGVVVYLWGEQLERKIWLLLAGALALLGGVVVVFSQQNLLLAFGGVILLSMGSYLWLPVSYSWTTEQYPTRARASGFALVDGLGHLGGGIGVYVIVPLVPRLGPLLTFLFISSFLLIAAGLALFGPTTRGKQLDDISP